MNISIFIHHKNDGIPYGIRTRVAAVKGRCPKPLDERDTFVVMIIYKTPFN